MNEEFMAAIGPNYIADCGKCGVRRLKRNMTAMYIKHGGREGKMKLMCHLCEKCLPDALEYLGVAEPKC